MRRAIIAIPAFVFLKIFNEKLTFNVSLKKSIIDNKLLVFPVVIMCIELYIIKYIIGTNKIGYAGVTSTLNEFVVGVKNIILNQLSLLHWMQLLGLLGVVYFVSFIFIKSKRLYELHSSLKEALRGF